MIVFNFQMFRVARQFFSWVPTTLT